MHEAQTIDLQLTEAGWDNTISAYRASLRYNPSNRSSYL